jgi:hypothetical protein
MKEKFENRRLTGKLRVKLERDDHDCGKYWEADKQQVINCIISVLKDYKSQGYILTLRQLYYQLVSKNIMPNDNICYSKLSSLLDDCRYSGVVDWDSIEDRGRVPYTPYFENSVKEALQRTIDCYKLDKRLGQDVYVELWSEKDAISNILKETVKDYTLTVGINKGFASSTAMYNAYMRFMPMMLEGKKVVVLYAGDHDPSGLDMVRDIRERLEYFMSKGSYKTKLWDEYIQRNGDTSIVNIMFDRYPELVGRCKEIIPKEDDDEMSDEAYEELVQIQALCVVKEYFVVKPICLTREQIDYYNLPPNPAKISDPRAKKYIEEHGDVSWEVDALSPRILRSIILEAVKECIDMDKYEEVIIQEEKDIEIIRGYIANM